MKISVIMWDGNFRKFTHTIDFFMDQTFRNEDYEIIWVDFYKSNERIENKFKKYKNGKLILLNNNFEKKWHIGICINKGIKESKGKLLIIPDSDIIVEKDFLEYAWDEHKKYTDLVLYFKRFDEKEETSGEVSRTDINYLKKHCVLINPTNYAGCMTVLRDNLEKINGFETHNAFSGSGMIGIETYIRFRNKGMCIKWSKDKCVYHPWHPSTGIPNLKDKYRNALRLASHYETWINPYAGLEQSWIVNCKSLKLDIKANSAQCDSYLENMPKIDINYYHNLKTLIENKINIKNELINLLSKKIETDIKLQQTEYLLKEKNLKIESLQKQLEDKIALIQEKDKELSTHRKQLEDKIALIQEKDKELSTHRKQLEDKIALIQEKDKELSTHRKQLEDKIALIQEKDKELSAHRKQLEDNKETLQKIINSKSWRIATKIQKLNLLRKNIRNKSNDQNNAPKSLSADHKNRDELDHISVLKHNRSIKNCLILGSGRSGTSMMGGILFDAGYFMGNNLYPAKTSNPKGFFENAAVNGINEEILENYDKPFNFESKETIKNYSIYHPDKWQRWLMSIPLSVDIKNNNEAIKKRIISALHKTPFAYKDPRFCYTLPVWKKYLKNDSVYICVFRKPNDTISSILKECASRTYLKSLQINAEDAFNTWFNMYSHILEKHHKKQKLIFVHYDQIYDGSILPYISKKLGVELKPDFVSKELKRSKSSLPIPHQVKSVYNRLCKLANYS